MAPVLLRAQQRPDPGAWPLLLDGPSQLATRAKEICSHKLYEPRSHCPLEKANSLNKCLNTGRMAGYFWPHIVPAYRALHGNEPQPLALAGGSRIPSAKLPSSQCTYTCSAGSTPRCCSFPFGILWSITMVSVLAKQNPLDLMISENENSKRNIQEG